MISIHQALDIISSTPITKQEKPIAVKKSMGYSLASDIKAPFDLPTFDNSAMDGYAVCGNGPEYEIIGEIQAGNIQKQSLREGQAFRIFTGAKIPAHSTAVIMQEKAIVTDTHLTIQDTPNPGKNIRRKGEQIKASQVVFETGQKIIHTSSGPAEGLVDNRIYYAVKVDKNIQDTVTDTPMLNYAVLNDGSNGNLEGANNAFPTYLGKAGTLYYYESASKLSNKYALFNLGWMYYNGENVNKDVFKAYELYKMASDFGHPRAMYNLANMHFTGTGTVKDLKMAYKLFLKSKMNGIKESEYFIEQISISLKPTLVC